MHYSVGTQRRSPSPHLPKERVREIVAGASSSMPVLDVPNIVGHDVSTTDGAVRLIDSTTEGAVIVDVGTTEGSPNVDVAGSRKLDPAIC
uniref:Uncharacterized protein n=1 Tax=Solanum tuberosum TaxID=4113 RepID=M1DWZ6_SOLTU